MTKEVIDEILKDTDGRILYVEQMISILDVLGYGLEAHAIRKMYAKRQNDRVKAFEEQLRIRYGSELVDYVISKIRPDIHTMYYKCHESAYLASLRQGE